MNLPFHIDLSSVGRKKLGPDASRDWFILLGVGIIALIASVGMNLYLYHEVMVGAPIGGSVSSTAPAIDTEAISKISTIFSTRATQAAQYENGADSFVDPTQ